MQSMLCDSLIYWTKQAIAARRSLVAPSVTGTERNVWHEPRCRCSAMVINMYFVTKYLDEWKLLIFEIPRPSIEEV